MYNSMSAMLIVFPKEWNYCSHFLRRISVVRYYCSAAQSITETSQTTRDVTKVEIPKRKKRNPLSILQALSSTVKQDRSVPEYKYIDDPFLIPGSEFDKRSYSLAAASGKKAAQYVVKNNSYCFKPDPAQPTIQMYKPDTGPQITEVCIEALQERIVLRLPSEAFDIYQQLLSNGVTVPVEVEEDLLDLLCVYNSKKADVELLPEERFFYRDVGPDDRKKIRKTWNDKGDAEKLFKNIKSPSTRAYCSLVRGRAKYFQADKAFELYNYMKDNDSPVDTKTFNALIGVAFCTADKAELRWQAVLGLLKDMSVAGVNPDRSTFNAVLYNLTHCTRHRDTQKLVVKVINEMKACGYEPDLTSWAHVIQVFYTFEDSQSTVLQTVLNELEGREFVAKQPTDYDFFFLAMIKCCTHLKDLDLAYKIDRLLNTGNNSVLLGDSFRRGLYFTNFLRILCVFEQIDKVMQYYQSIVPHTYVPGFTVMDEIITAIEYNEGYQYIPQIWPDILSSGYTKRADLMEHLLNVMTKEKTHSQLQLLFCEFAENIHQTLSQKFTGKMFGDSITLYLSANKTDKAVTMFDMYYKSRNRVSGFPSEESLVSLTDICLQSKDTDRIMKILELMSDLGYHKATDYIDKVKVLPEFSHLQDKLDTL